MASSSFILSEWDANDDLRALPLRGMNLDAAAYLGRALAHEAQSEFLSLGRFQQRRVKTRTVILDDHFGAAVVHAEADVDAVRPSVFSDIRERFLDDAQQLRLDHGLEGPIA
jgi:hypothetical protein